MKKTDILKGPLSGVLENTVQVIENVLESLKPEIKSVETGTVSFVGQGIARIRGLPGVKAEELIRFSGDVPGIAFNLDPDEVSVILLGESSRIKAGDDVYRTGQVVSVPVGEELLGRVVDPLGRALDNGDEVRCQETRPIERPAPEIMARAAVNVPLQTGIKVIDALIPIGRGQRELILGDRQSGKTAIALDTILNQTDKDVLCVYCAIGQRSSAVTGVIDDLRKYGAMENCIVVVATGENAAGLNFIAPYAATSMAEYFMDKGRDVLIVYDDLTHHARSYRELCLLLRRPPAREAYPGDIFYIHSRLLERATHLRKEHGGGSLTALPIVETEAQNISAYIPTNVISITDGQIYLSPELFREGVLPAVDVGKSVSRVGGKTQLPVYRAVAGDLRLSYSQFEELETFARFGTKLDKETQKILERGIRVREILKQNQYEPMSVPGQIIVFLAVTEGFLDSVLIPEIRNICGLLQKAITEKLPDICKIIESGVDLTEENRKKILDIINVKVREKINDAGRTEKKD